MAPRLAAENPIPDPLSSPGLAAFEPRAGGRCTRCSCVFCRCGDDCRCNDRGIWLGGSDTQETDHVGGRWKMIFSVVGFSSLDVNEALIVETCARNAGATDIKIMQMAEKLEVVMPTCEPEVLLKTLACPGIFAELVSVFRLEAETPSQVFTATLKVTGMTCAACVGTVERSLLKVKGVSKASVNLLAHRAEVTYSRPLEASGLVEAIEDIGFDAELLRDALAIPAAAKASAAKKAAKLVPVEEMVEMQFQVDGMTCAACVGTVERAIKAVPGVTDASVNLLAHRARAVVKRPAKADDICDKVDTIGFDCKLLSETTIGGEAERTALDRPSELRVALLKGIEQDALKAKLQTVAGVDTVIFQKQTYARIMYWPAEVGARKLLDRIGDLCSYAGDAELDEDPTLTAARLLRNRFLLSVAPTILTLLLAEMLLPSLWEAKLRIPGLSDFSVASLLLLFCGAFVQFVCGRPFHTAALAAARHRNCTMNTLVSLSTTISFLFGAVIVVGHSQRSSPKILMQAAMFMETASVLVMALLFGRVLEARAKALTTEAVKKLSAKRPKVAMLASLEKDVEDREVLYDLVEIGDVLRVKPGELVPVDGEVCSHSTAHCDESLLTGEAWPVPKGLGSKVVGGSTLLSGSILMRAEGVGNSTTLAQIVQLVEDAQARRPSVQRVVDVVASYFVPVVIVISIVTYVVWTVMILSDVVEHDYTFAVLRAVSVLVIACPCSLGLATPTAIMVATGIAAKHGCLVKDAVCWEKTRETVHVVLDKTGTLTQGKPEVVAVAILPAARAMQLKAPRPVATSLNEASRAMLEWLDGEDFADAGVLAQLGWILASAEAGSEHPLARALLAWGRSTTSDELGQASDFQNLPGSGISCNIERAGDVKIGNLPFVGLAEQESFTSSGGRWAQRWMSQEACIVVALSVQGQPVALFALRDELQPAAGAVVRALQKRNISVWMCTGDMPATAHVVAAKVGIAPEQVKARCLPETKADFVAELERQAPVIMVGDGVNDAAALSSASLGVAIGAGSHVSMEAADVVLVRSSLSDLLTFLDLGRATMRTMYRNFVWALIFNIVGIPLAAGVGVPWHVTLPPIACGVAMACSSVTVVLSSVTLKLWRPRRLPSHQDGKEVMVEA
eukprot:TRINITY_DN8410_c0_g1_i1.p1 TRINITY_DN8410_c0_g1~~TRINITY_DN8410_c0_g1_i1.p1  ORF type:complete len:1134 (+),score=277.12 TRINITY_DN8410_c0_g1_i1:79-3480(+)